MPSREHWLCGVPTLGTLQLRNTNDSAPGSLVANIPLNTSMSGWVNSKNTATIDIVSGTAYPYTFVKNYGSAYSEYNVITMSNYYRMYQDISVNAGYMPILRGQSVILTVKVEVWGGSMGYPYAVATSPYAYVIATPVNGVTLGPVTVRLFTYCNYYPWSPGWYANAGILWGKTATNNGPWPTPYGEPAYASINAIGWITYPYELPTRLFTVHKLSGNINIAGRTVAQGLAGDNALRMCKNGTIYVVDTSSDGVDTSGMKVKTAAGIKHLTKMW
jgi:hypothetical protein